MTMLALIAFFELMLYIKKHCLIKAVFLSVLGAILGWLLLTKLGQLLPLTEGTAMLSALFGLPGVLLLKLSHLLLI